MSSPSSGATPVSVQAPDRVEVFAKTRCILVKVGTRVLTNSDGRLDLRQIGTLSEQLCCLAAQGRQVILVSSGAVGAGLGMLGWAARPTGLAKLQAVAAMGQTRLIQAYDAAMQPHGYHAAQVLLTAEDLRNRQRYLNVRNALAELHALRAIAIINENDSVAVEELMTTFGDNDRLAAAVSGLLHDALMIILSDVQGLMTGPPEDPGSELLSRVASLDQTVWSYVQSHTVGGMSKGGMASKLQAVSRATSFGHAALIASGRCPNILTRLTEGEPLGTLFMPAAEPLRGRRRWIGSSAKVAGCLHIDDGARIALASGRSLLAIGVTACEGVFQRGDCVAVRDPAGKRVARGLSNYSNDEICKILGLPSDQIIRALGHRPYDEVLHRDNLVFDSEGL